MLDHMRARIDLLLEQQAWWEVCSCYFTASQKCGSDNGDVAMTLQTFKNETVAFRTNISIRCGVTLEQNMNGIEK